MKWLLPMMVFVILGVFGCAKAKKDTAAESVDEVAQADTDQAGVEGAVEEVTPTPQEQAPGEQATLPTEQPISPESTSGVTPPAEPSALGVGETLNYTVKNGDTLMKIAFNIYGDILKWRGIYEMNKDVLKDANQLSKGMTIKYDKPATEPVIDKNGDPYLIKRGDTLCSIANHIYAKCHKWRKLYENNQQLIKDPNKIYAGFYIYYQISEQEKQAMESAPASTGEQPKESTTETSGSRLPSQKIK